jgi:hypothetical protein
MRLFSATAARPAYVAGQTLNAARPANIPEVNSLPQGTMFKPAPEPPAPNVAGNVPLDKSFSGNVKGAATSTSELPTAKATAEPSAPSTPKAPKVIEVAKPKTPEEAAAFENRAGELSEDPEQGRFKTDIRQGRVGARYEQETGIKVQVSDKSGADWRAKQYERKQFSRQLRSRGKGSCRRRRKSWRR